LRGPIPRASMGALTTKNVAGDKNDEYKNTLLPLMLGRQSLIREQDPPAVLIYPSDMTRVCCVERPRRNMSSEILQALPIGHLISLIRPAIMQDPDRAAARSRLNLPADCS
jgi:hypothetical protein